MYKIEKMADGYYSLEYEGYILLRGLPLVAIENFLRPVRDSRKLVWG